MPKPPYFPQAYPFSCVPACLRMILAAFNFEISEPELRSLCKCDETGTTPSNAVKAAKECGFNSYKANLTFDELKEEISVNNLAIVFLRLPVTEDFSNHAVIVFKITKGKVLVLDPAEIREREFDINSFVENWSRGLTIIVEKKN